MCDSHGNAGLSRRSQVDATEEVRVAVDNVVRAVFVEDSGKLASVTPRLRGGEAGQDTGAPIANLRIESTRIVRLNKEVQSALGPVPFPEKVHQPGLDTGTIHAPHGSCLSTR